MKLKHARERLLRRIAMADALSTHPRKGAKWKRRAAELRQQLRRLEAKHG